MLPPDTSAPPCVLQALDVAASHLKLADACCAAGSNDSARAHGADARGLLAALAALTAEKGDAEGAVGRGEAAPVAEWQGAQGSGSIVGETVGPAVEKGVGSPGQGHGAVQPHHKARLEQLTAALAQLDEALQA